MSPEGSSWLTPHARVGPSRIEGTGLLAVTALREGETVMRLGGRPAGAA